MRFFVLFHFWVAAIGAFSSMVNLAIRDYPKERKPQQAWDVVYNVAIFLFMVGWSAFLLWGKS